jgi:hypothetical protein
MKPSSQRRSVQATVAKKKAEAKPSAKPPPKPAKKAATSKAPRPKKVPATKPPAAAKRPPVERARVEKTSVVIPLDYYEPHKDAIKAPLKEHGLKWTFLGEGKGLYKREKEVHCFTQFKDDGVHYSIWGDDKAAVRAILDAWRALAGEDRFAGFTASGRQAAAAESQRNESDELRLWRLGEPQRRPGEPDFFYQKRVDEWKARRPGGAP